MTLREFYSQRSNRALRCENEKQAKLVRDTASALNIKLVKGDSCHSSNWRTNFQAYLYCDDGWVETEAWCRNCGWNIIEPMQIDDFVQSEALDDAAFAAALHSFDKLMSV